MRLLLATIAEDEFVYGRQGTGGKWDGNFASAQVVAVPVLDVASQTVIQNDWLTVNGTISHWRPNGPDIQSPARWTTGDYQLDEDFYKFTLTAASGFFAEADAPNSDDSLDLKLDLYYSSQQLAGSADDNYGFWSFAPKSTDSSLSATNNRNAAMYFDLPAGDYYIKVSALRSEGGIKYSTDGTTKVPMGAYDLIMAADTTYSTSPPAYDSNPGAGKTVYLDFNGYTGSGQTWNSGGSISAAAFNFDANAGIFSPAERLAMENIWRIVSEDYRPFDINVSTNAPADSSNVFRTVITSSLPGIVGQSAGTLGVTAGYNYGSGNVAPDLSPFINTASNSTLPNYVSTADTDNVNFIFTSQFPGYGGSNSGLIMALAMEEGNSASHEIGHAFGLVHYQTGPAFTTIMAQERSDLGAVLNRETWSAGNLSRV